MDVYIMNKKRRGHIINDCDWGILENILRSHYGVSGFSVRDVGYGIVDIGVIGCGSRFVGIAMVEVYEGVIGEDNIEVLADIDNGDGDVSCLVRVRGGE